MTPSIFELIENGLKKGDQVQFKTNYDPGPPGYTNIDIQINAGEVGKLAREGQTVYFNEVKGDTAILSTQPIRTTSFNVIVSVNANHDAFK